MGDDIGGIKGAYQEFRLWLMGATVNIPRKSMDKGSLV